MEELTEPLLYRWQHRAHPPNNFEAGLADTLMATFGDDVHDLPGIVERLNGSGVANPRGGPWTRDAFESALRDLASP